MISYGLASAMFTLTHSMTTEEMIKTEGVLSIAFLTKMSEHLDMYTAFAPKGTPYEYSNGEDNYMAYDVSIEDIMSKKYGNAKIINDVTMKEKFNAVAKGKTLDEIIKFYVLLSQSIILNQNHPYKPNLAYT